MAEETSRILEESHPITTIGSSDETLDYISEETHEIFYPVYDSAPCDFSCDTSEKHITAHYDDTGIGDGYIIDYDLYYYDYDVDTVSIYNATKANIMGQMSLGPDEAYWLHIVDPVPAVKNLNGCSNERIELSNDIINSFSVMDYSDSSVFRHLSEDYDLFPYGVHYFYPVLDIFALDEPDEPFSVNGYIYFDPINDEITTDLDKVTLRVELDGIPVGIPSDNHKITTNRMYGDLYGSVFGVEDDCKSGYISLENHLLVDFLYYNYDLEIIDGSTAEVMPLEECIENSLPGALAEASMFGNYCLVYGAELVYIPFSVGCSAVADWDFEVVFVPVWALYTYSYNSNIANASCIFLNAFTGELVSSGL